MTSRKKSATSPPSNKRATVLSSALGSRATPNGAASARNAASATQEYQRIGAFDGTLRGAPGSMEAAVAGSSDVGTDLASGTALITPVTGRDSASPNSSWAGAPSAKRCP